MNKHDSMRGWFSWELNKRMKRNKKIHLIVGDLGYKIFDHHFAEYPDRCINVGASEQAMMGVAVGMAMEGKIPFVYSITTFLLFRPFETIRNYLHNEQVPVKLIGSGREQDYAHDGYSHWPMEDKQLMTMLDIYSQWPDTKEEIPDLLDVVIKNKQPSYINLKR